MTYKIYTIKRNNKGRWEYYYERANGETVWDTLYDVWSAKRFETREEADEKLIERIKTEHWGGIFQIEEFYVSK